MRRLLYPFVRLAVGRRFSAQRRRALLPAVIVVCGVAFALVPQYAAAEAVAGPEPAQGPSGLPDGRVYEQASPTNKNGNEAGAPNGETAPYMVAGVGGDEVAYSKTGPLGEAPSGFDYFSIARRSPTGWHSRAAVSRGEGKQGAFKTNPEVGLGFSAEMGASVFGAKDVFVPEQEPSSPTPHLYKYNEDGSVEWIGKPTIAEPRTLEGGGGASGYYSLSGGNEGKLAGASPDFNTIYYAFEGVLTSAEEVPDLALGNVSRAELLRAMDASRNEPASDDGFFEWHEGALEYAGVLPDGYIDPYGAVPAGTGSRFFYSAEALGNQVSEDGRKAFFVSPDPSSGSGRPSELYVRETAADGTQSTVLVSRDLLLPEVGGLPSGAPSGASFSGASSDGSHVFFESGDQLTSDAPNGSTAKEYVFDTETNTLSYLPGVGGPVAVSRDGSSFLFELEGSLEVWDGGMVTELGLGQLSRTEWGAFARSSASGSVFVFQSGSPFTSFKFNNGEGSYEEIYRYEVASNELSCVSCPPAGVAPTGNAALSHAIPTLGSTEFAGFITGNRGVSEDGSRVFFDTPDPLVSQDTNGVRDVYEWDNGTLYLISTGVSQSESFFGDNSPSGNDVFFSTTEGLVSGDTDESYDVYDARVPRPGDQLPPSVVPCEGAVCQGPPSVPQLLSVPASAAFDGAGQVTPPPAGHSAVKGLTRKAASREQALRACKRGKNARKRAQCVREAHKRYGAKASSARQRGSQSGRNSQHNGRGK